MKNLEFQASGAVAAVTPQRMANALRMLAVDAVERARSGHPGAPMGMADIAQVLWTRHLKYDPADPQWIDRDRFVLSNGHASMLLYGLLHLSGYDLPLSELKQFRQLHSKTPGHPELGVTPGVETTTGPLGQGLGNAVGMALAERLLAAEFNRPGLPIVDHFTYVFIGDGCLMEGISHEVCSLAGTLGLSKLIAIYDDNGISIDGEVAGWFTDDTPARFRAYGWHVIADVDGHDANAIDAAISEARSQARLPRGRPSLICCKTIIGKGSPNRAGTESVHGAPLGAEESAATRRALGWDHPPFEIPQDIRSAWHAGERGARAQSRWQEMLRLYRKAHPQAADELMRRMRGELPADFDARAASMIETALAPAKEIATRKASQFALEALGPHLPELLAGSADLTGSNLTDFKGCRSVGRDQPGNYLHYGVREFGMSAAMNGVALHGGFVPYGGTFLTFSDYSRNAVRMAALMRLRVIHVFTHDSIGLGEDGPTHQAIEHAASLRLIPNLDVWRPADTLETAVAWQYALQRRDGPSALLLSRQNVALLQRNRASADGVRRGGYVLSDSGAPCVVIVATGSEIGLAIAAQRLLEDEGIGSRVVSMPCTALFDRQPPAYRNGVMPISLPAVAVEAGHPDFWHKYVGRRGSVVGIDRYGESAPAPDLYRHFGLTAVRVAAVASQVVHTRRRDRVAGIRVDESDTEIVLSCN
ncbi:MAG: cbbT2 [Hydrocarboniphaga sp.]|uniref:transketolase n=1 Tax=Hydrocarboniphaga sp. TaxID=2033016 RepID=UPI0026360235|nr:transketolase [Hydrocarboniphaga sp.]MDB5969191.1 cbbT2 [Hydrocarboniphaga sp.]